MATTIPSIETALKEMSRPRWMTFVEGPMSGWLYRHLRNWVDRLAVCDARRNRLVAKDSDKDDPIDAEKLAQLLRGGFLKEVHPAESLERAIFKQTLWMYAGIGLERSHSGAGPTQLHVAQYANRRLRGVLLGAAMTVIGQGESPFYDQYRRWTQAGISAPNAGRSVARSLAATLWRLWKNGSNYRPQFVGQEERRQTDSRR